MIIIENRIVVRFQEMKRKLQVMIDYNQLDETKTELAKQFLMKYSDDNLRRA